MNAAPLTPDLLDALLDRAQRRGMPGADKLQPGLTDAEIDRIVEPTGWQLPHEARVLWRWRNGVPPGVYDIFPSMWLLPVDAAVRTYFEQLEMANDMARQGLDPEESWPRTFCPLIDSQDLLAVDCAGSSPPLSPVHLMATHDWRSDAILHPETASVGQLVTWWIEAYDSGLKWWDPAAQCWQRDETQRVPAERRNVV